MSENLNRYLNRYYKAVTNSNQKDGNNEEVVFCNGVNGEKLCVKTVTGNVYMIQVSSLKQVLPTPTPNIKFKVGASVEFVYDYHPLAGESTTFGKIISCDVFFNNVTYSIQNFKDEMIKSYAEKAIRRVASLKTPTYSLNQKVGVVTVPAHNQFTDDIIENATIVQINPDFLQVTYSVRLDSGSTLSVKEYMIRKPLPPPRTSSQSRLDEQKFLRAEEERLIAQLAQIRMRLKNY